MTIAETIENKLRAELAVAHLQLENESHMHSGPATDSHFKLVVVSDGFAGKRLVQRHQLIYRVLADELAGPVHALAMHLYTAEEWQARNAEVMPSPNCLGGSKADQ